VKEMKKFVVVLLVIGLLVGTALAALAEAQELLKSTELLDCFPSDHHSPDVPAPCGGGDGGGEPG
jgi:hypothetical protein